jgi:hypothetical protein
MKRIAPLLAGIALVAGCSNEPITTETSAHFQLQAATSQSFGSDVNKQLAALRQVTASFQQFENGKHAGWSTQITECLTDAGGSGGMGFHYGNTSLINGTASVETPQLLLYEPEKNGRMRLVAVEYIIPYSFHRRDAAPPTLFGRDFAQVDEFGVWGLHAWVWKENPNGMFAAWNPTVNCDNTTSVASMSH